VLTPLEHDGVDFWWLDWQQERDTRSLPGLTNLRWLNHQFFHHSARHSRRGASFSRWAGLGDHRHPVHFSGDAHSGWAMLAFQIEMTAVAGNVLCAYWSHDVGGHFGPRNEETMTRWVQFASLSPVLRLHSARSARLDRRPWSCAEPFVSAQRRAYALRAALMPTIVAAARACHDSARPLCRPMYLAWPRHEESYDNPQQYMLGDHLLCAPAHTPGVGTRPVASVGLWFPPLQHAAWHDLITSERHDTERDAVVGAAIDEIPIFAPGGVPIIMADAANATRMASPIDHLVIRVFPGEDGQVAHATLYEDDGISDAYTQGGFATTPITARWKRASDDALELTLVVNPIVPGSRAARYTPPATRTITLEIGGVQEILHASPDASIDPPALIRGAHFAVLRTPHRPTSQPTTFTARFRTIDFDAFARQQRARRLAVAFPDRTPLGSALSDVRGVAGATNRELIGFAAAINSPVERGAALAIGAGIALHHTGDSCHLHDLVSPSMFSTGLTAHPSPPHARRMCRPSPMCVPCNSTCRRLPAACICRTCCTGSPSSRSRRWVFAPLESCDVPLSPRDIRSRSKLKSHGERARSPSGTCSARCRLMPHTPAASLHTRTALSVSQRPSTCSRATARNFPPRFARRNNQTTLSSQ
jgi:hypothetical protein